MSGEKLDFGWKNTDRQDWNEQQIIAKLKESNVDLSDLSDLELLVSKEKEEVLLQTWEDIKSLKREYLIKILDKIISWIDKNLSDKEKFDLIYKENSAWVVFALQYLLNEQWANLKLDGVYWPNTIKAVKEFQAKNGLKDSGKAKYDTLKKLLNWTKFDLEDYVSMPKVMWEAFLFQEPPESPYYKLDLSYRNISSVSLEWLKNLKELDLTWTRVKDLDFLKWFTDLEKLSLKDTRVSDISALEWLKNLKELDLSKTEVSDISSLKGLTNLEKLSLKDTKISDISALEWLTNLRDLDLSWTKITDIKALKWLKKLRELDISLTGVEDLEPVEWLDLDVFLYYVTPAYSKKEKKK